MDLSLILALAVAGLTLGMVEGVKPGPLLTMVIRETLSGGFRAGMWTASAPIFTDGPLVLVSLLAASWIATQPTVLILISIIGAGYLLKMGLRMLHNRAPSFGYRRDRCIPLFQARSSDESP